MKNLFLIGYMGTGKSTVASYLAKQYDLDIVEMDQVIVEREGKSIEDIFATHGENYFRDIESKLLEDIQSEKNKVVSCGGGVVLRDQNVTVMKKSGHIVLLTAVPQTILERVKDDEARPLLKGNKTVEFIQDMMEKRRPYYESAADVVIDTDGKTVACICDEIMKKTKEIC